MTSEKLKSNPADQAGANDPEAGASKNTKSTSTGWEFMEDEPMPERPASKWDILKKVPFAGAIYERGVQKKELARQIAWRAEQGKKREASLAAHQAEHDAAVAEQARLEQERLEFQRALAEKQAREKQEREDEQFIEAMKNWRRDRSPAARAKNERRQEIAERAFNDTLTPVDLIAAEAESGSPEVSASTTEYEGKEIPVYILHGRELKCFVHAINFKGQGGEQDARRIGAATAVRLQNDPSFWDTGREEVVARSQNKEDSYDNESSVSSTLSTTFLDTNRNFAQVDRRGDVWDYGFSHLAPGSIVQISPKDGGFVQGKNPRQLPPQLSNNFLTPDQITAGIGTVFHNEFYLNRYDEDGKALKPDFILTSSGDGSYISDVVKKHAAYFNIPIFSIDQAAYREKDRAKVSELVNSLSSDQSYEEMIKTLDAIDDSHLSDWRSVKKDDTIGRANRDWRNEQDISFPNAISRERRDEVIELEFNKKLDFIRRRLTAATAALREATANGQVYDARNNDIIEVRHCDTVKNSVTPRQMPDLPTSPAPGRQAVGDDYRHRLEVKIKLNGHTREYFIHDGKHPAETEGVEPTSPDTPDYYAEFAPLVDDYLAALEENSRL